MQNTQLTESLRVEMMVSVDTDIVVVVPVVVVVAGSAGFRA